MAARLLGRVAGAAALAAVLVVAAPPARSAPVVGNAPSAAAGVAGEGESLGPARLGVPAFTDDAAEPVDGPLSDDAVPVLAPDPGAPPAAEPPAAAPPASGSPPTVPGETPGPAAVPADGAAPPAAPPDGAAPTGRDAPPAGDGASPPGSAPGDELEPGDQPPGELEPGKEVQTPSDPSKPLPEIHIGEEGLPEPVRRTRQAILDAARSGDIEALRPVLEMSEMPPTLAKEDTGDPVAYLKGISGDLQGREILAILVDLLDAGWVVENPGTPQEMYVWPYFADIPVDRLTPPQLVELYRILTSADVDEMQAYDTWLFFKIGIGPDGTWHYFMVTE